MSKNIKEIKNFIKDNRDVWIIASGASMDYIDPNFFIGKTTIGINNVHFKFPCSYVVMKDLNDAKFKHGIDYIIKKNITLIYSELYRGDGVANHINYDNSFYFQNKNFLKIDETNEKIEDEDDGKIISTRSTITSAMHIAAFLGFKNILVCGHDAGFLDNKLYYEGYDDCLYNVSQKKSSPWWTSIENDSIEVRNYIIKKYKCNIYSLNPFLNFGLEGHKYENLKKI